MAQQTVEIVECGYYSLPDGRQIDIARDIESCLTATTFYPPDRLRRVLNDALVRPLNPEPALIEFRNETTLSGAARVLSEFPSESVAALNFASAKNPGGGFLSGSEAQEESLARSSALYASLQRAPEYYQLHRSSSSCLYTHSMILSPNCPVFRNDAGDLLAEPYAVTFITSAAPNAGAIAKNNPQDSSLIEDTLRRRAEYVLALAYENDCNSIVLGAWGCGVFRNDPEMVARVFAEIICGSGSWNRRFTRIVFAVLDRSETQQTFESFREQFGDRG